MLRLRVDLNLWLRFGTLVWIWAWICTNLTNGFGFANIYINRSSNSSFTAIKSYLNSPHALIEVN
jgi:hypothetical protein